MLDPTEDARRAMLARGQPLDDLAQEILQDKPTWTTEELSRDFVVLGFLAPFVHVKRKSDGVEGSMEFTHSPRLYFGFQPK